MALPHKRNTKNLTSRAAVPNNQVWALFYTGSLNPNPPNSTNTGAELERHTPLI